MKSKFFIILISIFFFENLFGENISIVASNVTVEKEKNLTIFEKNVIITTKNKTIKSDYVRYDKKNGYLIIKDNILAVDDKKNTIQTNYAEYFEKKQVQQTRGKTQIKTSENYILIGEDLFVDNINKIIKSEKKSVIKDQDRNEIFLENFEYSIEGNLFKSIGSIKFKDKRNNNYEFSQIYIDTKKKEIVGTDSKSFLNDESFKINKKNNQRIFANTVSVKKNESVFDKSIFTLCQYRKNDKCPPWTIQSKKMTHDNLKKTIYYKSAIVKVYDIPIFYFPALSHPDPTVKRRSGFLPPALYDTKNLGSAVSIPYFFDLGLDKNFTLTNRFYIDENPLFLGEYHQAFKNSNLLADFGFTEGYKKTSSTKKKGDKSHFFGKFVKNFDNYLDSENTIDITLQEVSNDKYLKLYKIESNLVDHNTETLENSINFFHSSEDLFFGINTTIYETLKDDYEDKYEYILPEVTLDKRLFLNDKFGSLELQTNYKVHNYDTNKLTNFLVNDFYYNSNNKLIKDFLNTKIFGNIKNINYENKNINIYKEDPTTEIFVSIGLLSEINLQKNNGKFRHLFKPKMLLRLSPGSMRQEDDGPRLDPLRAFSLDRISNLNNYETGNSATFGFDYKIKDNRNIENFNFSVAQIVNEKENKKMADRTSLNEKLSDLVGSSSYTVNENFKLNYNFSIDQNYNDVNYNELGSFINYGALNIDFNYLSESKHIGDQDYFKTELNLRNKDNGLLSFKTKRNLITNSSEFYNLSYEYINDCLRAGLVYRREFYSDSELEPENSLMFKITLVPFGNLDSPKLD